MKPVTVRRSFPPRPASQRPQRLQWPLRPLPPLPPVAVRLLLPLLLLLLLLAALTSVTGCRGGLLGAGTVSYTDDAGRQVALPKRVQRVVSLAPATTEILYAVGAGAQVVGVDAYSNYPEAAAQVAKVGDYAQISVESVVALKPDVVLASSLHGQLLGQMEQLGLKVLFIEPRNMEGVYKDIELVGRITGREGGAAQVVSGMKAKLAAVAAALADLKPEDRPTVYYEVWADPLMSAGPRTYIHEVIQLAGGVNLARDADVDYPILAPELIIGRNPAVIVCPDYHGAEQLTPARLAERPGWGSIAAVRNGRVHAIDADLISRGGPRLADAVVEMAKLIHPDRFR